MKLALEAANKAMKDAIKCIEELGAKNKALEEALAKQHLQALHDENVRLGLYEQKQEPVAHCEAGPDYCQQCHLEDESLALAAAVRYVKNNAPKLVSDEICNALNHIPDAKEMVGDLIVEYDMENSAFAKDLRAVLAQQLCHNKAFV